MYSLTSKILRNSFKACNVHKFKVNNLYRTFCDISEPTESQCPSTSDNKKGLILGIYLTECGDPILTPAATRFNEKLEGKLLELITKAGDLNKPGRGRVFNNVDNDFWSIAVVCLGKECAGMNTLEAIDEGREIVRKAAGVGAALLQQQKVGQILIEGLGKPEQAAEGSALSIWLYQENRQKRNRLVVPTLQLYDDAGHDEWQRGLFKAEAQNIARQFCESPSNHLTPSAFTQAVSNILCPCGVKVEIHDKDWLETNKLEMILAMARGSCEPPVAIECSYCGGPADQPPICMVGSGITYDSGGLCLKKRPHMYPYRSDIIGAATVVSVLRAASTLSLPININGFLPVCENMPSGMAIRTGDILKTRIGRSVGVHSTNNEGQLIIADSLTYIQAQTPAPRLVIDIGSTTFPVRRVFGCGAAACFSNSEVMWKQIRKASVISGDRLWRLPLWRYFKRRIDDDYLSFDLSSKATGSGAPCLAAAFVHQFITCVDWIHLDTSGVGRFMHSPVIPYYRTGSMSGRPVRTLVQLMYQLACPNPCDTPQL